MTTREVQRARERFLSDHDLDRTVSESISTSWRRSKALNVRADRLELPFVREPNLDSPLVAAATPVLAQLADGLFDEPVSVILTSADGVVLSRLTASTKLNQLLDDVQLAPGYSYSEAFAGTNGIGTALETRQPTLVRGAEHYAECLGKLACAGVPIVHPISGTLVGALDLTGWVDDCGPLLSTLAKSATAQIEGRLLSQASAKETALLNAYLKSCSRSPQSMVVALGDDVVLMNRRLRWAVDAQDQAALLEHAVDHATHEPAERSLTACLPSGRTVRLTPTDDFREDPKSGLAVFHVHLIVSQSPVTAIPVRTASLLPGIAGTSSSWRRSCELIADSVRGRQWVAVSGEQGSGRCAALKAAAAQHISSQTKVFSAADFDTGIEALQACERELAQPSFSVILRDVDRLSDTLQTAIADIVSGREEFGWIGATVGGVKDDQPEPSILSLFGRTVPVPALRHRVGDLHDLVPFLLRQLTRGADLTLSPAAMRQLCKYTWPGNVDQLRQILREVVQRQRSGVVGVEQLPPICRALSRHTLTRIEALERDAIIHSLEDNHRDKRAAAQALGISRATIYRKIKEFGIDI